MCSRDSSNDLAAAWPTQQHYGEQTCWIYSTPYCRSIRQSSPRRLCGQHSTCQPVWSSAGPAAARGAPQTTLYMLRAQRTLIMPSVIETKWACGAALCLPPGVESLEIPSQKGVRKRALPRRILKGHWDCFWALDTRPWAFIPRDSLRAFAAALLLPGAAAGMGLKTTSISLSCGAFIELHMHASALMHAHALVNRTAMDISTPVPHLN